MRTILIKQILIQFVLLLTIITVILSETLSSRGKINSKNLNTLLRNPVVGVLQNNQVPILVKGTQTGLVRIEYYGIKDTISSFTEWGRLSFSSDLSISLFLTELEYNKIYMYRIEFDDSTFSPLYQFSTFPAPAISGKISFVFSSCLRENYTPHDVFDFIKPLSLTFVAFVGDNIYADKDGDINIGPAHSVLPALRSKYTRNFDEHFQEISSSFPIIALWDDHDYGQDNSDSTYVYKSEAKKVFKENFPTYPYVSEDSGIYYRFSIADVDFFVLDTRWYRSPMQDDDIEGKTMLGNEQLDWLLNGLKQSTAPYKIIFSSVSLNDYGGDTSSGREGFDNWIGYKYERDQIFSFLEDNNIRGVMVFSGDQHYPSAHILNWRSPLTEESKTDTSIVYSIEELGTAVIDFSASPLHYTRAPGHALISANQDNPLYSFEIFRAEWAHPGSTSPGLTSVYGLAEVDTESPNPSVSVKFYELDPADSEMVELYRIVVKYTGLTAVSTSSDYFQAEFLAVESYPNPFNGTTTINYTLPLTGNVELIIYDLSGREVRALVRGSKNMGRHSVKWDGKNDDDIDVSSGIYFYKITLRTSNLRDRILSKTKRMTYIK